MSALSYFVIILLIFRGISAEVRIGEPCQIEDFQGQCMLPTACPSFKLTSWQEIDRFVRSNCGFAPDLVTMVICCPETKTIPDGPRPVIKDEPMNSNVFCNKLGTRMEKQPKLSDHVNNGMLAEYDDFPQFAALAIKTKENPTDFSCGGVLISENFVLTAAHCLLKSRPVMFVRFGIIDLNDAHATDVKARSQISHPWYRYPAKYHDIGLIELDKSVLFTFYVWPACLYQGQDLPMETFDIAGFGGTGENNPTRSNDLLKGNATEVPIAECSDIYEKKFEGGSITGLAKGINSSLICARDLIGQSDTCGGDSGSGLHRKFDNTYDKRYVVGVVSSGFSCASELPSFYTRIYPYLDWIDEIVWPRST